MKKISPLHFNTVGRFIALVGAALLWLPPSLPAQPDPIEIHQTETRAIKIHHQLQKSEAQWAAQKAEMLNRLQTLQSKEKTIEKKIAGQELQLAALHKQQAEMERQAIESARIRDNLETHLEAIVARLEKQMNEGLPFLPDERTTRIESIKTDLVQPAISLAEKCRRVMEALKVEAEYGHTVEVVPTADPDRGPGGCATPDGRRFCESVAWRSSGAPRTVSVSVTGTEPKPGG